ncbi:MAG: hypothetical protein SXG53_24850 [Pseudomonadota bacterium]|nr:hypothetical protein [Pseudomonadota bacterium]
MDKHTSTAVDSSSEETRTQRMSRKMPAVAAALRREQVAYVRVIYQGQWDSGRVEDPLFYRADGGLLNSRLIAVARRELSMFFRELLELRYPGWSNSEGSRGEFEWELIRDELTHVHGWRQFVYDWETLHGV